MNLDTCALCQFFLELSVWGKVAMIAGYILVALVITLYERSKVQRDATRKSPTVIPRPAIKMTEKLVHTISASTSKENQHNPLKRTRYPQETCVNSLGKCEVYCESHNAGQKYLKSLHQYLLKHMRIIVNTLRRGVNQSGKEPFSQRLPQNP